MMKLIIMNEVFLWRNLNSEAVVGCASVLMKTISLLARAAPNVKANSFLVRTNSPLNEREYIQVVHLPVRARFLLTAGV